MERLMRTAGLIDAVRAKRTTIADARAGDRSCSRDRQWQNDVVIAVMICSTWAALRLGTVPPSKRYFVREAIWS